MQELLGGALLVMVSYLVGSVPFSNLVARAVREVDLRTVGTGTVSGTGLYLVAGFPPVVVAGLADIAKGAAGPLVASSLGRPMMAVLAGAAAVTGHNWSLFLGFSGGRGLSPAIGALTVIAWPGAVLLLGALAVGRLVGQTALAALAAVLSLTPLLAWWAGGTGTVAGVSLTVLIVAKRLAGNAPPPPGLPHVYGYRLLFDRDTLQPLTASPRRQWDEGHSDS